MYIKHTLKPNYNSLKQFATHYCPEDWFYEETLSVFFDTQLEYHKRPEKKILQIALCIKLFNKNATLLH